MINGFSLVSSLPHQSAHQSYAEVYSLWVIPSVILLFLVKYLPEILSVIYIDYKLHVDVKEVKVAFSSSLYERLCANVFVSHDSSLSSCLSL